MKSPLSRTAQAIALATLAIGAANASPVIFTDTYTPASSVFLEAGNSTYTFTQSVVAQGFNSTTDTITDASLELFFRDDRDAGDGSEKVDIYLDNQLVARGFQADSSFVYHFTAPFTELNDGSLFNKLIDVRVGGGNSPIGDFFFDKSILTVTVERLSPQAAPQAISPAANDVPEPTALSLAGLALAGLGFSRKKRKTGSQ